MRFAAVDVGTNSIHLLVVEIDPYVGAIQTLLKAREMVRLGGGDTLARGRFSKKTLARGVEVVTAFVAQARRLGALEIRVAATSAVRDAKNRGEFIAAVEARAGVRVEVLSGRDEARLIHLGVSRGATLGDALSCIVDIGGGSTEFIVADQRRTYLLRSLPLGSLRLYERFKAGDAVDAPALEAYAREALAPLLGGLRDGRELPGDAPIADVVGTSGTWLSLAALDAADRGVPFHRSRGAVVELARLRELQARMIAMTPEQRRTMPGMNARRGDIIVAGNAVAIATLEGLGLTSARVCDRALREGLVAEFLRRHHDDGAAVGDERLGRLDAARALARRFGRDDAHEAHVAGLASELFDALGGVERYEAGERDLLVAAAFLHDVGHAVARSAHHKHGAYVVRHADLPGWRPKERETLAQLVRYHRKAPPKAAHAEFTALDAAARRQVERLAALLRMADGLDARHLQNVQGVDVRVEGGRVTVVATAEGDATAELAAAAGKADLFARLYGAPPRFEVVEPRGEERQRDDAPETTEDGRDDGPRDEAVRDAAPSASTASAA